MLVDAHNDLLVELAMRAGESNPLRSHWLDKLRQGGVVVQVCPASVDIPLLPESGLRVALEQILTCHRAAADNRDDVTVLRSRAQLDEAIAQGKIGFILSLEGVEPLGYNLDLLDVFWLLGVRMVALTWNRQNPFAGGAAESPAHGLSGLGKRLLDLMVRRGIALDLAHASEATFFGSLERVGSDLPKMVSHACCRAIYDVPRNLSDDQMRALAAAGGVLGVMAVPLAVDVHDVSLGRVVDHIDHAVSIMGIDHVGLGGDFMYQLVEVGAERPFQADAFLPDGVSMGTPIEDLKGPEDYPNLLQELERRGYSSTEIASISGGNMLRILRQALPEMADDTLPG